jgi:hypothetical protein
LWGGWLIALYSVWSVNLIWCYNFFFVICRHICMLYKYPEGWVNLKRHSFNVSFNNIFIIPWRSVLYWQRHTSSYHAVWDTTASLDHWSSNSVNTCIYIFFSILDEFTDEHNWQGCWSHCIVQLSKPPGQIWNKSSIRYLYNIQMCLQITKKKL